MVKRSQKLLVGGVVEEDSQAGFAANRNPQENRAENRFTMGIAMAVAHIYSLMNEGFVFPFSRILLLLVWKFSKSEFLGDAVNAAFPRGFGSKRLKELIDQKTAGMDVENIHKVCMVETGPGRCENV